MSVILTFIFFVLVLNSKYMNYSLNLIDYGLTNELLVLTITAFCFFASNTSNRTKNEHIIKTVF